MSILNMTLDIQFPKRLNHMFYIVIEEQPGILINIVRCLSAADYKVISNKLGKRASDGKSYVKLEIGQGSLPIPASLEGELLNINGCSDILYDEPAHEEPTAASKADNAQNSTILQKEVRLVANEIMANYGNIENILHGFYQRYQDKNISDHLYSLGLEVGATVYEKKYALGKPLKLEAALKRMLSDAVKKFGKISCNKNNISIENNILCNTANPSGDCDFTRGFMMGFLRSSPTTKDVRGENISCRSYGPNSCSFEFH